MYKFKHSYLLKQLVSRDFKVKYKRSILGVLWSFFNPLLMMLVQYIVFSTIFRYQIDYYAIYLLCGIVTFNYFSEASSQSLGSILWNSSLITKVYLPKYIFPISKVLSCGINFCVSLIPLFILAVASGLYPKISWLLLPVPVCFLVIFLIGMGLILSVLMVYFRDVQFLWSVILTAWMYATPIFYPADIIPASFKFIQTFNPIFHIINFMRVIIIDGVSPGPTTYWACIISSLGVLAVGWIFYNRTRKNIPIYL